MNTFHLMRHPGSSTVKALGRLNNMCGWSRPIVTDSGGFQAYSLIRENPKNGYLNDNGITYVQRPESRKFLLTPEKAIQLQLSYGTDLAICLDDCTHPDDAFDIQQQSVNRTLSWARRSKSTFDKLIGQKELSEANRPLLFAVIQGGTCRELRKRCAEELQEIGFDGFGFGGWPLDSDRNLLIDIIGYTRELVASTIPMHALGIGHPLNVVEGFKLGYQLFDSSLPTRDARNGRLYAFGQGLPFFPTRLNSDWFSYMYINDKKHIKVSESIFARCDCQCCVNYSVGYLHHLFAIKDSLFMRLATIHNLRFMVLLTQQLKAIGRKADQNQRGKVESEI